MSLPNHDELKNLFESDPIAFEAKRKALIAEHISNLPSDKQESLNSMQKKIDSKLDS